MGADQPVSEQDLLQVLGRAASELGVKAWIVGGFVRDLILRNDNTDIDIVVEGDAIALARTLAEEENAEVRVHKKFGTAKLIWPGGHHVDMATARLEYYDYPAALPRVEVSSIKLDLYRRDFTVNALAVNLSPGHFGELIDFFGGLKDIKDRVIRVLHNLSFVEDPTRIFRALRFEQRMGFQIARHTHFLMETAVRLGLFGRLSGRRLFRELVLCLGEEKPFAVIKRLGDYGLLKFLHPRLRADRGIAELFQRLQNVVSWYDLLFTGERYERWMVAFLGLADPLNERETREFLCRLSLAERFQDTFAERKRQTAQITHRLFRAQKRSEIYALLNTLPTEFLLYAMGKTASEETKKNISLYFTTLKNVRVSLRGRDLKQMGLAPGPVYSEIFQALLRARLDGKLATREEELDFVRRKYGKLIEAKADVSGAARTRRKKPGK